jgi:L-threonylcarbamoyladenylate synthase
LEKILGRPVRVPRRSVPAANTAASQLAPGLLARHYSPRTPLTLHRRLSLARAAKNPREAFLFFRRPGPTSQVAALKNVFWLSEHGDAAESAHNLFARLRQLDRAGWKHLHAEPAPASAALAPALNDRLARAAAK